VPYTRAAVSFFGLISILISGKLVWISLDLTVQRSVTVDDFETHLDRDVEHFRRLGRRNYQAAFTLYLLAILSSSLLQ
jgi:hypothetical protein